MKHPKNTFVGIRFSEAIDTSVLNLYDTETGGLGPADVTLVGDTTGQIAGSLVLGFLDLQSGQAQNRFYLELENWLSSVTDLNSDFQAAAAGGKDVTQAMERIASQVKEGGGGARTTAAMASLAEGIQALVKHMRSEQQLIRDWVETQSKSQNDVKKLLEQLNNKFDKPPAASKTRKSKDGF